MTSPDPARRWCLEAVDVLRDAATAAGQLAAAVAVDWPDAHGDEWAHRIAALSRSLDDAAHHAADLAARPREPRSATTDLAPAVAAALRAASSSRATGPRLADTSGGRADDDYGMRIAELPDPPH